LIIANFFIVDTELQSHSNLMDERRKFVERRFQSALFREALGEMDEDKNLLLFLDSEFERDQLTREIRAKGFLIFFYNLIFYYKNLQFGFLFIQIPLSTHPFLRPSNRTI
jgi:hypothetical protein